MLGVVQPEGRGALRRCAALLTPPEGSRLLLRRRPPANWKEDLRRHDPKRVDGDGASSGAGGSCNLRGGLVLTDHSSSRPPQRSAGALLLDFLHQL